MERRRSLRAAAAIGQLARLALALTLGCAESRPDERPDILLVTLDTTRADHLSCYGGGPASTPNLDQLAARGLLFERAHAQASVTPVSHASIFTGQNPYRHGLRFMHGRLRNRLPDEARTLAEVLRDAGYQTAAFTSAFPVTERFGFRQGFEHFDQAFLEDEPGVVREDGAVDTGGSQRRADATTRRARAWLDGRGTADATPQPRFVWVHYFDPHDVRVQPPDEFVDRFGELPQAERALLRSLYAIEVVYMDAQLGRLLSSVDLERTIVAVVADHGEGLGDHDWWTHGVLYEEQIRVPLILAGPGVTGPQGARRVATPVRTIDLAPTLLDAVGVARAQWPAFDGRSLLPLLHGGRMAETAPPAAYADSLSRMTYHFTRRVVDRKDDRLFVIVVRTGEGEGAEDWKYVHHELRPEESELYELVSDPRERRNLLAERPEQAALLRSWLERHPYREGAQPSGEAMEGPDAERLRALGYVE